MSYFHAGAWWSASGKAFSTQAEADAADASGASEPVSSDEFAAAMGNGSQNPLAGASAPRGQAVSANGLTYADGTPTPLYFARQTGNRGTEQAKITESLYSFDPAKANAESAARGGGTQDYQFDNQTGLYYTQGADGRRINYSGSDAAQSYDAARTPIFSVNEMPAAGQGGASNAAMNIARGGVIGGAAGPYGAAAGAIAGGFASLPQASGRGLQLAPGDPSQTGGLNRMGTAEEAAQGNANYAATGSSRTPATGNVPVPGAATAFGAPGGQMFTPAPNPTMTPEGIMAMQSSAARPASTQQDQLVQQMMAQSAQQSGYQDFNSPEYTQSRSAATGYTSQLAGLANNNIAETGINGAQYNQSRGLMDSSYGNLNAQATNNIGNIQADAYQRDQSRGAVMGTADRLTDNAGVDIGPIQGQGRARTNAAHDVKGFEQGLRDSAGNNLADIQADSTQYNQSRATSDDIIQRLIAASALPESQSQAQALLLNAQERATRNAYGDAGSLSGGWRSQLTGQRRALGQAAAQQADIGAQMAALRASEEQQHRQNQLNALGLAGGFSGDMGGRDLSLAQSDAALLAQIRQGNQENTRLSNAAGGQLSLGRMQDESQFATADADRMAQLAMSNQQNRLNSLLGAGGLQTGAMQSDTGLAQSNASLAAQIAQANQRNSLDSYIAAGGLATNMNSNDLQFATNDSQQLFNRQQANQSNSLAAMMGAANAANTTAGLDANIGTANADRRATVDQNNRANSIAALQNAGVLSSATRGQDVQLSIADQQALSSRISAASNLAGTTFATQMEAAIAQGDQRIRMAQVQALMKKDPTSTEKWLNAAGSAAELLGLIF